jgi:group I intron endonuclease
MTTLKQRLLRHKVDSRRSTATSHFYRAIRKYGEDAFIIYPLIENIEDKKEADTLEKACIDKFKARNPKMGYNVSLGGDRPFNHTGMKRSKESRERYRNSRLGSKNPMFGKPPTSGVFKSGSAHPNHGHPHPPETIEKMKKAQRERWAKRKQRIITTL